MLRLAARLANNGIHPTPEDKTLGAWITAQMVSDPNKTEKRPMSRALSGNEAETLPPRAYP